MILSSKEKWFYLAKISAMNSTCRNKAKNFNGRKFRQMLFKCRRKAEGRDFYVFVSATTGDVYKVVSTCRIESAIFYSEIFYLRWGIRDRKGTRNSDDTSSTRLTFDCRLERYEFWVEYPEKIVLKYTWLKLRPPLDSISVRNKGRKELMINNKKKMKKRESRKKIKGGTEKRSGDNTFYSNSGEGGWEACDEQTIQLYSHFSSTHFAWSFEWAKLHRINKFIQVYFLRLDGTYPPVPCSPILLFSTLTLQFFFLIFFYLSNTLFSLLILILFFFDRLVYLRETFTTLIIFAPRFCNVLYDY